MNQADLGKVKSWLLSILKQRADAKALAWMEQQAQKLREDPSPVKLFLAFGASSRFFKKENLHLSPEELEEANSLRDGFQPVEWDLLQVARTYLLLLFPSDDQEVWHNTLQKLFETADMHEQETLYAALPLLPFPESLVKRAAEGIRTNITSVFDAIALDNPYPADFLDQDAWNQMVLKAVFLQRPLYRIYKAEERANEQLARMLIDFAHERWAAGRQVMPGVWRFIGPFLNDQYLADIQKVIQQEDELQKEAALLACSMSSYPGANKLLNQFPEIKEKIQEGKLNWQYIGETFASNQ